MISAKRLAISMVVTCLAVLATACSGARTQQPVPTVDSASDVNQQPAQLPQVQAPPSKAGISQEPTGASPPSVPYDRFLSRSPDQLERELGKPTWVENLGSVSIWHYESLGVDFEIATQARGSEKVLIGLLQTKGKIFDTLQLGDSEERVTATVGPIRTISTGDRIAQRTVNGWIFTIYIQQGHVTMAIVKRMGVDD